MIPFSERLEALEVQLGWTFSDRARLQEALTHSTYANEHPGTGPDNERLEFVGDAVLGLLVAKILYETFEGLNEGDMSRRRARVVRRETLAALARELDLGGLLRMGQGQSRSGHTDSLLADAYEALVGAVFLDGGFGAVEACFTQQMTSALADTQNRTDYKTQLQEACHRRGLEAPTYRVLSVEGPDHARIFRCQVMLQGMPSGEGVGSSKKLAEQRAARLALDTLAPESAP